MSVYTSTCLFSIGCLPFLRRLWDPWQLLYFSISSHCFFDQNHPKDTKLQEELRSTALAARNSVNFKNSKKITGILEKRKKEEMALINFEATELRLGLPGNDRALESETPKMAGKRTFAETNAEVDCNLKLGGCATTDMAADLVGKTRNLPKENLLPCTNDPGKPPAPKAQVVGWPPVRSFRKNILAVQSAKNGEDGEKSGGSFVKVSMDGAPYLRKVDLKMYKSYQDLSNAMENMFSCFTIGMNCKDFMNESKLTDLLNGSEYVPTYEDKDGDWMLVGDVPWEMFVDSCKRLRIMKGSEAIGLAPRAVEKCKSRS